jgi:hypothetical protein
MKNYKIANDASPTKATEKISTDLESLEVQQFVESHLTKFKNNRILLNKMSHRFLVRARLLTE